MNGRKGPRASDGPAVARIVASDRWRAIIFGTCSPTTMCSSDQEVGKHPGNQMCAIRASSPKIGSKPGR